MVLGTTSDYKKHILQQQAEERPQRTHGIINTFLVTACINRITQEIPPHSIDIVNYIHYSKSNTSNTSNRMLILTFSSDVINNFGSRARIAEKWSSSQSSFMLLWLFKCAAALLVELLVT